MDQHRVLWPSARVALNLLLLAAAGALVLWLAARLRLVVVPALAALLAAGLLMPLADAGRRRGLPSALASAAAMALAGGLLALALVFIAPPVIDQLDDVGAQAQEGLDRTVTWLTEGPLGLDQQQIERSVNRVVDAAGGGDVPQKVLSGAVLLVELLAGILLWVVLTFFVIHDGRRIWHWGVGLLPAPRRAGAEAAGIEVWTVVSGYMRGVVIVALVDAVLIGLALLVIGVPLVLPLAVLTFIGAFVPLVGAVVVGAVAALVALVSQGVLAAVLVVAAITVIQQLEGDLLYPVIVGKAIDLHPVAILLVLTAGTVVAGLAGAVVAVPLAAAAWAAVSHYRGRREVTSPDDRPASAG